MIFTRLGLYITFMRKFYKLSTVAGHLSSSETRLCLIHFMEGECASQTWQLTRFKV